MLPRITGTIALFLGFLSAGGTFQHFTRFYAEAYIGDTEHAIHATLLSMPGIYLAPVHEYVTFLGAMFAGVGYWRHSARRIAVESDVVAHVLVVFGCALLLMIVSAFGQRVLTLSGANWKPLISQYIVNAVWLGLLGFLAFKPARKHINTPPKE